MSAFTRLMNAVLLPVVVAVVAAAVLVIDQLVPRPVPPAGTDVAAQDPVSGLATCAVGDLREGTELAVFAAHATVADDRPALLRHRTVEDGQTTGDTEVSLASGGLAPVSMAGGDGAALAARWHDAPVVVARSWELDGEDLPPGIVTGPCPARAGARWVIPGLRTEGGAEARLRLANPYETDATVAIRFLTPEGPVAPTILQNVTVSARDTIEVVANEHVPERLDLGAEVQVASGRVLVEGYQLMRSAIGGIDGASLLAAATRPADTWTIPWMRAGEGRASWLWIYNPAERPAAVELTLHTDDGGIVPEGLGEVTVAPRQLRRVDLAGTFPQGTDLGAVTLRSPEVEIFASGAVESAPDLVANTGLAVQLGVPAMDDHWVVVAGPARQGRTERLQLVNPGSETAVVDVALWNGGQAVRPTELAGVAVPAGSRRGLELAGHLTPGEGWAAFVTASEGELVVGHVGFGGQGPLRLVAGSGVPVGAIADPAAATVVLRHDPGLAQRLDTGLGVRLRGRLPVEPTPLAPDPSPPAPMPGPEQTPQPAPPDAG